MVDRGAVVPRAEMTDHGWLGDDDGHNCAVCQDRDDSLHLCWPQAHRCDVCEVRLNAWPDVLCAECRSSVVEGSYYPSRIESILSQHQHVCGLSSPTVDDRTMCACGELFMGGPGYWRRHVAEMIYEALGLEAPAWIQAVSDAE